MQETKTKEDYSDLYSWRADNLWKEVSEPSDLSYPRIINYFVKSGKTPISGRQTKVKPVEYPKEMYIKEAFKQIELLMMTKGGKLRKKMENLQSWEEYSLIALLNYLREEWGNGNRETVQLSWQEFYLLKEGGFKKKK